MDEFYIDPLLPYETQRDNWNLDQTPNRSNQCMIESFAYLTRYAGRLVGDKSFSDITAYSYLHNIEKVELRKKGENRFHGLLHIRYLNFVFKDRLEFERVDLSFDEIRDYIKKYKAPVISGFWIGHLLKGAKSHISPIIGGYESGKEKGLKLHDPYGDPNSNYKNHNGENVKVSDVFLKKMIVDSKEYDSKQYRIKKEYL